LCVQPASDPRACDPTLLARRKVRHLMTTELRRTPTKHRGLFGRTAVRRGFVIGAAILTLALAACGGDEDATAAPTMAPTMAPTSAPTDAATSTPAATPTEAATEAAGGETVQAPIGGFTLPSLTVAVGATVVWSNADGVPHTATARDGTFDSGILNDNRYEFTFTEAGTFAYFCEVHPTMEAEIIVE